MGYWIITNMCNVCEWWISGARDEPAVQFEIEMSDEESGPSVEATPVGSLEKSGTSGGVAHPHSGI